MKSKLYTILFIGICFIGFACKTASKLYEKGKYDEAVQLAAKKLQKKPNDPELLSVIQNAYDYAVHDHESRIQNLVTSQNELKYEWIYNEYQQLQKMYDAIYNVPSMLNIVQPIDYSTELISFGRQAGEVRYDRGIAFMQRYTKQNYKDAYYEFEAALRFLPGDVGATQKMQEAYEYAVTNVAIVPARQNNGFLFSAFTQGENYVENNLIRNLANNSGNKFVQFYDLAEAGSRGIRIDQFVDIDIPDIQMGHVKESYTTQNVAKKIIVKTFKYKPDSIVSTYATVKAKITTTSRKMDANMQTRINILNADGRRLWNDYVTADYHWQTTFSGFSGDKRALSDDDLKRVNEARAVTPSQSGITDYLLRRTTDEILYKLRNYFNRF